MNHADVSQVRKSRRSTSEGNCVMVGQAPGMVAVFDSKQDSTGPVLAVTGAAWTAFLTTIR
jgi:Domain of unknown function (DUF397)